MSIAKITTTSGQVTFVLPVGFQMEGTQVSVRRRGKALILEPIADNWQWLDGVAGHTNRREMYLVLGSLCFVNSHTRTH